MPKYCCFQCPAHDYSERTLTDTCANCGNLFGFPLLHAPTEIGPYRIVHPLNRGFYAAAYIAESGRLATRRVLKVSSKKLYAFFRKDFEEECEAHKRLAEGTEHVVKIDDMLDCQVTFGSVTLECHAAVLYYVNGTALDTLLQNQDRMAARKAAQIGIDLFRILEELQNKVSFHNDLHGGNIIIEEGINRADAIDPTIRAVAIDLASLSDESKSDSESQRLGDIHWIARHLRALVVHLLRDPDSASDLDHRLASSLEEIAHRLMPSSEKTRLPSPADVVDEIRDACKIVSSPWREPLRITQFSESYNAQTLAPWYVPMLLVDPGEQWLHRMSTHGPQIITGMRGCGKTLFLRALQFHARAAFRENESQERVLSRLQTDEFVGLYVSTSRLLDSLGDKKETLHEPYAKLFAAYSLEAMRAVHHLRDISPDSVAPSHAQTLAEATADFLRSEGAPITQALSAHELQRALLRVLVSLSRGESAFSLSGNPAVAFPHLAEAIQKCSPLWTNSYVLFLLDDVSTRYLEEPKIYELLSALQFQSTSCAFKITSEAQTLELALRSPGQVELARAGRDYIVFDLGAEVYNRITKRPRASSPDKVYGKHFVEQILRQRSKYYSYHPTAKPSELLGDASLESIANDIASSTKTSKRKKEVYHGITALSRVCVGDIGDVISLYELIIQKGGGQGWPLPRSTQSESFQDFCSRRVYDLNRRKGELKDFALTFAQASHELMVQSYRVQKTHSASRDRLRQYMSIYVRITTGNIQWQYEKLMDLIDSGLFVFAGGSEAPRAKTKDSNPIQQFKLTYRKVYGLSSFIGLAESDRFELSGDQLEEWLRNPANGKDVLLRNLGGDDGLDRESQEPESTIEKSLDPGSSITPEASKSMKQGALFETIDADVRRTDNAQTAVPDDASHWLNQYYEPHVETLRLDHLSSVTFDCLVLGLGFEARTLASARRLSKVVRAKKIVLIKYPEAGKSQQIKQIIRPCSNTVVQVEYQDIPQKSLPVTGDHVLIDITGLAKPVLFSLVRDTLKRAGHVWICHSRAASYYPLDRDIARVLRAERRRDHYALLASLGEVLTGEEGPYTINRLHSTQVDTSRRRVLFAFASAKHQRLMTLLDYRDYDQVELVAPQGGAPRSVIARIAAHIAAQNFPGSTINQLDSNDLQGILTLFMQKYYHWYVRLGFNFDLALTGSKLQGVACAAISSSVKTSDCLYVSPKSFDPKRFTKGVGKTSIYKLTLAGH